MKISGFLVTLPPPTPNGGLHVGHMSGPYLAADVFSRAARLSGKESFMSCYTDIHQTYVRATAERQGIDPSELYNFWSNDIRSTLDKYNVSFDDFFIPEEEDNNFVRKTIQKLYSDGKIIKKTFPFFFSESDQRWHDEAGISGNCPVCLARCKCGICEACGELNSATTLVNPHATNAPNLKLTLKYQEVLVLEMEKYRNILEAFYKNNIRFRERYRWLISDIMNAELPDFPVSSPGTWGIQLKHKDLPNQVINAWPEVAIQLVHCYKRALSKPNKLGEYPVPVNFFGFDNTPFVGILNIIILALIEEGRWLPYSIVINEFYNLDHEKFSTSNNHVIWAAELLSRTPVDAARFYLAFNSPGFEKSNFTENDLHHVISSTINSKWSRISYHWNKLINGCAGRYLPAPSQEIKMLADAAYLRITRSFSLERFHLRQAAEDLLNLLDFIVETVEKASTFSELQDSGWLLVMFSKAAYPLIPSSSESLYERLTGSCDISSDETFSLLASHLPHSLFYCE